MQVSFIAVQCIILINSLFVLGGGKEPAHECPYCPYRAKQRGNLGVHVRKHHADLPQLESRRKKRSSV